MQIRRSLILFVIIILAASCFLPIGAAEKTAVEKKLKEQPVILKSSITTQTVVPQPQKAKPAFVAPIAGDVAKADSSTQGPAVMTFDQIDRRIGEIPSEARPGIRFDVDRANKRDGFLLVYPEGLGGQSLFVSHLVGFTVFSGDLYVMHLSSQRMKQGDYTPGFHRIIKSGDRIELSEEDLPFPVARDFDIVRPEARLGFNQPVGLPKAQPLVSPKKEEPVSEPVRKEEVKEKVRPKDEGFIGRAPQFLEKVFRLRKVGEKREEVPQASAQSAWVWSPSEGKFVSPATTAGATEKTAEEQYQHALQLREAGKTDEMVGQLQKVVRQYPQSAYAPEAQFLIAALFEEKDKPLRAAAEFQKLIREFPRSERIDEAVQHLFKIGNQFLAGEKQKVMGVAIIPVLSKAADIFRFIVEQSPYGPYGDQAQLALGTTYRKMGNFEEAVKAFEALIENYPSSLLVDEAHYQLAETSYEFSQNVSRDQKTLSQAAGYLKDFIKQYGSNTLAERARILKQRLDEQDAEKNYRIGLYYEKQGFVESALIYYEDVASRYSETIFGKKAAERFGALNQPALAKQKGEAEIERRVAEVRSMLEALEEESKRKGADAKGVQDTAPLRGQLETELATLTLAQRRFHEETKEKFHSRRQTLREREKNLREKFKIFENRKKLFKDNPSPELEEAFQKWEQSLKKEQVELFKERQTVRTLGFELKTEEKASWFSWIPYFGKPQTPSREELIKFQEKEWIKLEQERAKATERRKTQEKELAEVAAQIAELDAKEFEIARKVPLFQELLSVDLKKKEKTINEERGQVDESIRLFEEAKKEYQSRYGSEFLKTLTIESNVKSLQSANELITSGANLEETLKKLQSEKASLSLAWLTQKERLNTVVKAFGETQPQAVAPQEVKDSVPPSGTLTGVDQEAAARILKKRIKYLEREIRSRVDQIEDWQRENTKRMDQLEELLHAKSSSSPLSQTAEKVFTPATGAYKLGKAFLFGLPHRERELMQEAKLKTSEGSTDLTPGELEALRELREEIELQSILIQGRAKEIEELQSRLGELRKQADQIPNFSYQTILVERFPYALDHSLTSARELLGEENQEAIFQDRVNRQKRELERLESALNEINQKIETVGVAIQRSEPQQAVSAGIVPSILGGAETLPSAVNESSSQAESEGKQELESKLVNMKSEIIQAEKRYQEEKMLFDRELIQWYQTEAREKILLTFPAEGRPIVDQKERWNKKQRDLQDGLVRLVEVEYRIAESQKKFLDQKLANFEKRLRNLKDPSGSLQKILDEEIKSVTEVRDSLIRDISFLENYLKK